MGNYQEDGIGVKGFTSDRGSILKESPEGVAWGVEGDSGGVLPSSWGNPETSWLTAEFVIFGVKIPVTPSFTLSPLHIPWGK